MPQELPGHHCVYPVNQQILVVHMIFPATVGNESYIESKPQTYKGKFFLISIFT